QWRRLRSGPATALREPPNPTCRTRPVIARYTRPELALIWSDQARFDAMREVEVAACKEMDGPSAAELEAIRAATFTVAEIEEREKVTDHDVAAFVDVLSESAGPAGRWIHYGLTSSDVLDTGLALQLKRVGELVLPDSRRLVKVLAARAREHVSTLCAGRTHGIHAEPTTFGIKLAGFAFEADRNAARLERAFAQAAVGVISGAVGTYSATSPDFERRVMARLDLEFEPVSTQVVARDRHAELLQAIALAGAGLERFTTELRHLARTEVGEVREPFGAGQKGSSSMPHKRNPIKSEQVTGLARVLRGNAQAALENVALWHERDISHSSVERIILPDSTTLLDHMQRRTIALVEGMVVDSERMRENLDLTYGALFSQRLLLALVQGGQSRDDAYRVVQRLAQRALDERTPLRDLVAADPAGAGLDLDAVFDYDAFVVHAEEIVGRLDAIA
ncbi:MAG TPA: adenylosuccinate lyase, partial [Solirubrobacteraceae bacterium]|nr:adenylosuccinate lyase [Solirubrobacteraceae bacterium]